MFNGLTNLKELNMNEVSIIAFEPNILEPLSNLEMINMKNFNDNKIKVDNLFGTIKLYKFIKLTINRCNLVDTITRSTFTGFRNIIELKLIEDKIEQIGPNSLMYH